VDLVDDDFVADAALRELHDVVERHLIAGLSGGDAAFLAVFLVADESAQDGAAAGADGCADARMAGSRADGRARETADDAAAHGAALGVVHRAAPAQGRQQESAHYEFPVHCKILPYCQGRRLCRNPAVKSRTRAGMRSQVYPSRQIPESAAFSVFSVCSAVSACRTMRA